MINVTVFYQSLDEFHFVQPRKTNTDNENLLIKNSVSNNAAL